MQMETGLLASIGQDTKKFFFFQAKYTFINYYLRHIEGQNETIVVVGTCIQSYSIMMGA